MISAAFRRKTKIPWNFPRESFFSVVADVLPAARIFRFFELQVYDFSPAERIRSFTELDCGVLRKEFRADRTRVYAVTVGELLASHRVHDLFDRGDHGCRTAFCGFREFSEFFEWNLAAFHLVTQMFRELLQALVRNGRENGVGLRGHEGLALDTEEVCRTAFVDVLLFLCIEIDRALVTELLCFSERKKGRRVVTADLDRARTLRSGAVVVTADHHVDRFEAVLEVRTDRGHEHEERIFI